MRATAALTRIGTRAAASAAAVAISLFLIAPREAHAFCRTTTCDPNAGDDCRKNDDGCVRDGVILRWTSLPIVYRFHTAGSEKLDNDKARDAIRRAFEAWENVECENGRRTSLRFREGDDLDADKPLKSKQASQSFGIYFRDEEWPHNDAEESLALTNQIYKKQSGTIDYADIEINTAVETFSLGDDEPGIDLQAVLTHEVGHYIGLAHSLDPKSIMVARYCQSQDRCGDTVDRKRELSEDDIKAVCAAYEPKAGSDSSSSSSSRSGIPAQQPGCTTSAQTMSLQNRQADLAAVAGLGFLTLVAIRRRRERRG